MTISRYRPKPDDLVESRDHGKLVFQVLSVSDTGMAQLRVFVVSKQRQIGNVMSVPSSRLFPFKEDANQAAARIVRESTEEH